MIDNIKFNYRVATIIKKDDKILLHKNEDDDKKYHELMLIYDAEFDKDSNLYNKEIIKGKEDKSKLNIK